MNQRTLDALEFDKIRRILAEEASFAPGHDAALALEPSVDPEEVERRQRETTETRWLLDRGQGIPLGGLRDIRPFLEEAEEGGILEPAQFLDLAQTCEGSSRLRRFLAARADDCPALAAFAVHLGDFPEIIEAIGRCINDRAEVADTASSKLQQIRNSSRTTLGRIKEKLDGIIRSAEHRKALQDPIITMRQDRYVVPVRAEYRDLFPGIVHDRSASGVTLFVEPLSVVNLNNDLRQLSLEERDEVARILRELTAGVLLEADRLRETIGALGHLDLCVAKGRLSARQNAVGPELDEPGRLDLREARHPLLKVPPPGRVIPVSVRLGHDFDTMVITGPNTGGKTVTLKTVGLLTVMFMAGLHVPAAEGTRLSVFRGIWADIGDEQSIEQNLSTFSSHLRNIVEIIGRVQAEGGTGQLILLDEIGAGTDPDEGAALAMALLDFFHTSGARTLSTTHYSEIKAFVYEREGMINASVEFDVETLAPTYKLTVGLPGRSNAMEISDRLGLPESIIEQARSFLGAHRDDLSALIQQVEEDRANIDQELRLAREAARTAREMQEEQARKWAHLRADEEKVLEKAREEARAIVRQARLEASQVLGRLRDTERRLAALKSPDHGPDGADPTASPAVDPALPLDSKRNLDRLDQATREVLSLAERRIAQRVDRALDEGTISEPLNQGDEPGTRRSPPRKAGAGRGAGVVPTADAVRPGRTYYIAGLRHFGEVVETPDEGGMVGLTVGAMRLTVHLSDLRIPGQGGVPDPGPSASGSPKRDASAKRSREAAGAVDPADPGEPPTGRSSTTALEKALHISPEIHLRGLTVEEAIGRLDKYLDDALMAGLETVRVIHGRGMGILRQAVGEYLDEHPDVRSRYIAQQSEGGLGVTVVLLGKRKGGP